MDSLQATPPVRLEEALETSTSFPEEPEFGPFDGPQIPMVQWPATKIGVLAPFTGRFASFGNAYLDGARLALSTRGATSQVELVVADSQGDPFAGLLATRDLAQRSEIITIIGGLLNLSTLVSCVEANCNEVPFFSNVASEERISDIGSYIFHEVPSGRSEGEAVADHCAFQLHSWRVGVLYPERGNAQNLVTGFSHRFTDLGGQIVYSESYPEGTTDFSPYVRRLRRAAPDVVYLPVEVEDAILIVPSLAFHGVKARLYGSEQWHTERLVETVPVDLEGAYVPATEISASAAELNDFRRYYQERFGSSDNRFAAAGYVAASRVLSALESVEWVTRQEMQSSLTSVQQGERISSKRGFWMIREGQFESSNTP